MKTAVTVYINSVSEPADLSVLSDAEIDRFKGKSEKAGHVFALGRSMLRHRLAALVGQEAKAISLSQEKNGPVTLAGASDVCFSVSHSGAFVAVAVAKAGMKLGFDIEDTEAAQHDTDRIMKRYFHASEQGWINSQENPQDGFYQLWTLKEALTKMDRGAIAHYLKGTEVVLKDGQFTLIGGTPLGTTAPCLVSQKMGALQMAVAATKPITVTVSL